MEDVIKKIIEIDNYAKNKIKDIQKKQENIEGLIEKKLIEEKNKIDNRYAYKRKKIQEKYDQLFEIERNKLEENKQKQITKLQEVYKNDKSKILNKLINSII